MTSPPSRIAILDVLRGLSLLGIAALNVPSVMGLEFSVADENVGLAIYRWSNLLLRDHFFPVFSLLFGISFSLLMTRARQRGLRPVPMFLRRLGLLAALGAVHQLLQPGEVLLPYAVFGLLLLPFERLPLRTVLSAALLFVVVALWTTPILLTPAMFLLGLALQRQEVFSRSAQVQPVLSWLFPLLTVVGLIQTALMVYWQSNPPPMLVIGSLGFNLDFATLTGLVCAGAWVTGVWWWTIRAPHLPALLRPFTLLGRMSLSNYILQTLVFAVLGLVVGRGGSYLLVFPACLLAFAVNFGFSAWWLARYRQGPLEWLWSWGTALHRPALRRES